MKKSKHTIVISEGFCRRSSGLKRCKVTRFPIQAFGNDDAFMLTGQQCRTEGELNDSSYHVFN